MCLGTKNMSKKADPNVLDALEHLSKMYATIYTNEMRNTAQGHWINEAFVVRLWAVLEAHHVVDSFKSIDKSLPGAKEVEACRLLRQKIAHSTVNIGSKSSREVDRFVRKVFDLDDQESIFEGKYILSKDTVLRPMAKACSEYSTAIIEKESGNHGG